MGLWLATHVAHVAHVARVTTVIHKALVTPVTPATSATPATHDIDPDMQTPESTSLDVGMILSDPDSEQIATAIISSLYCLV